MSKKASGLASWFEDIRADYEMSRQSRFIRRRTGVAPLGGSADYHFRTETDYYNAIEQARDMDRNDGLVGTLADRRVDNIVQQGFTLDTKTGDKALDQDLWHRWQAFANDPERVDIAGELCFHEMERFACRAESIDGDIVVIGTEDGPLQMLEAHNIATSSKVADTFCGVTRDQFGRRLQYHVRYDVNEFGQKSDSAPIEVRNDDGVRQLFHIYNPKRVSMTRGVTQLAPVFALSGMLEDINFAKLVQQQIVSCFAIFRKLAAGTDDLPSVDGAAKYGEPSSEQTATGSRQLEGISPGMEIVGRAGEELSGFSPNVPNSEYFQQVKLILQIIGVNFGLPLCLVLMDGSETNFSGWRGAVDEARKGFVADQENLVRRFHDPVYRWWLYREIEQDAALRKMLKTPKIDIFGHKWNLPTWSYIEPVADAEGDVKQLQSALTSPRRMHAARGKDWETIADEIVEDNRYAIEKAQTQANEINARFPGGTQLSWRDLIPLPMPAGQTLALQDPNAIAAQQGEGGGEQPTARGAKYPVSSEQKRDEDGKFGSGSGKSSKSKEQKVQKLAASDVQLDVSHSVKIKPQQQTEKIIQRHIKETGDSDPKKIAEELAYDLTTSSSRGALSEKVTKALEKKLQSLGADVDETHLGKPATTIDGRTAYEWAEDEADRIATKQAVELALPIVQQVLQSGKPKAADQGEWRTTQDGGKIFIGPGGDPKFAGPDGPPVKKDTKTKSLPDGVTLSGDTVQVSQSTLLSSVKHPKVPEYKLAKDAPDSIVDYMQATGKTDPVEAVEAMIAENVHEDMLPQHAAFVEKYEAAINKTVDKLTAGTEHETAAVEIGGVSKEWHGKETGAIEDVAVELAEKAGGEKLLQTLRQYVKDNAEKLSTLYRKTYQEDAE